MNELHKFKKWDGMRDNNIVAVRAVPLFEHTLRLAAVARQIFRSFVHCIRLLFFLGKSTKPVATRAALFGSDMHQNRL